MRKLNFVKSNVKNNETKRALVESIQKNRECIDFLKDLETKTIDTYNYTGFRDDEIRVEVVKWILFNVNYNTHMFEKTLKQMGGNPNAIESFEWK